MEYNAFFPPHDGLRLKDIADRFGASVELVEYRIKRLGLWRAYKDKTVSLNS